jgi:hypothetical protein
MDCSQQILQSAALQNEKSRWTWLFYLHVGDRSYFSKIVRSRSTKSNTQKPFMMCHFILAMHYVLGLVDRVIWKKVAKVKGILQ